MTFQPPNVVSGPLFDETINFKFYANAYVIWQCFKSPLGEMKSGASWDRSALLSQLW